MTTPVSVLVLGSSECVRDGVFTINPRGVLIDVMEQAGETLTKSEFQSLNACLKLVRSSNERHRSIVQLVLDIAALPAVEFAQKANA